MYSTKIDILYAYMHMLEHLIYSYKSDKGVVGFF